LKANFIRAFGESWYDHWGAVALAELRRCGFNTVGNWSDWRIARAAAFPYVRPLQPRSPHTALVYRDFPDVFHPDFAQDAAAIAEGLRETVGDPAMIGYFLMNEPAWGFAQETPAAGMLFTTPSCAIRIALADFLRERYGSDAVLSSAWGITTTYAAVSEGVWLEDLNHVATADLALFSTLMVERFFAQLSAACRAVDADHLNLGVRYYAVPPSWVAPGMRSFDVISINSYTERIRSDALAPLSIQLGRPVMIGEWHFGALDVGLPGSGLGPVLDQEARGQAFRVYAEYAAAQPWCVGVHYFKCYDKSALGRFDGENWNIGFLDVCNRPYDLLASDARASHERLYQVARGDASPYDAAPRYLARAAV